MKQMGQKCPRRGYANARRPSQTVLQSHHTPQISESYAQIGRYETNEIQPHAEVLRKIADAVDTASDYLLNGAPDTKTKATLDKSELMWQFKAIGQMIKDDLQVKKNSSLTLLTQEDSTNLGCNSHFQLNAKGVITRFNIKLYLPFFFCPKGQIRFYLVNAKVCFRSIKRSSDYK